MSRSSYSVPSDTFFSDKVIGKSRFIAAVKRVRSFEEMQSFLNETINLHPKANHYCWAVIAGAPAENQFFRFSDDGEPSGTAGKPILTVLEHSGLGQTGLIVCRYFGGVKLGKGGLVRAYSDLAKTVIDETDRQTFQESITLHCKLGYEHQKIFTHLLKLHDIQSPSLTFTDIIEANLTVGVDSVDNFESALEDRLGKSIIIKRIP